MSSRESLLVICRARGRFFPPWTSRRHKGVLCRYLTFRGETHDVEGIALLLLWLPRRILQLQGLRQNGLNAPRVHFL